MDMLKSSGITMNYKSPETKRLIKEAMRKAFKRSTPFKQAMLAARYEFPRVNGNGFLSKKPIVRYKCAACGNLFPSKDVDVDHIEEVTPLNGDELDFDSYDELAMRICCDVNNLQVLCAVKLDKNNGIHSCHMFKTLQNRFIRRWFRARRDEGNPVEMTTDLIKQLEIEYLIYREQVASKKKGVKR
jgi:hypothetical protein